MDAQTIVEITLRENVFAKRYLADLPVNAATGRAA
jgi:hypothetical protein